MGQMKDDHEEIFKRIVKAVSRKDIGSELNGIFFHPRFLRQ